MNWTPVGVVHKSGGSWHRIPKEEFWNEQGTYPAAEEENSNEAVHATVELLTRTANNEALVKPCPSLAGFRAADRSWGIVPRRSWWQWATRSQPIPIDRIAEQGLTDFEKALLRAWVIYEMLEQDGQNHPAGEAPPGDILVEVLAWLQQ